MSQKGAGLIKTVFDTDNLVMRISEKILDLVTVNLLFCTDLSANCYYWNCEN